MNNKAIINKFQNLINKGIIDDFIFKRFQNVLNYQTLLLFIGFVFNFYKIG